MQPIAAPTRPSANDPGGSIAPRAELIERFDVAGPRYTSYPTADRFVEAFDASNLDQWLRQRASLGWRQPLSVYVHVPFCASVCYYCACNKIVTKDHARGRPYVDDLLREVELYGERLGRREPVSQLHFGGGTPTFLDGATLQAAIDGLERVFTFPENAERSIEVDPRTVDVARLRELHDQRFNRLSFGVQDFDADVQQAVHRVQSTEQVFELTRAAREIGYESINVDLIYGLPKQTESSFRRTLDTLAALRPDRVAVYGYAHLPQRFKPQRRIHEAELPSAHDKLSMMRTAIQSLTEHGYVYIGMDHFALPDDALAVAQRRGMLHRNFMGYTTQPDCDMIGLGVSAIGRMGPCYAQNARTLDEYADAVRAGRLPIVRGCELSRDDMLRRSAIMSIMCSGEVSFAALENTFLVDPKLAFSDELGRLREFQDLGLVRVDAESITVTPQGRFFVRPIAMVFDRYLRSALQRASYSRVL
ncbi:MAG: oxygen-independent coproporphyrinogen III oxidase [Burkholderiales bacterium]|jgi:oxygen-independent coproporphyrinogen-3 oxidase